jgi:AAA+ superfamily predicted ATPase
MFLTTNLFDTIDEAVESRVHFHIKFQRLSKYVRYSIWSNFLKTLPGGQGSKADVNILSDWDLNGRQIKNAVQMAVKWCSYNDIPWAQRLSKKQYLLRAQRSLKSYRLMVPRKKRTKKKNRRRMQGKIKKGTQRKRYT